MNSLPRPFNDSPPPRIFGQEALDWLDAAGHRRPMNDQLLSVADATVMQKAIQGALVLLRKLDVDALLKRQGFLARLTGADIEARLRLEVAAQQVAACFEQMERAALRARQLVAAMAAERHAMAQDMDPLCEIITEGHRLLSGAAGAEPKLRARFERRLANLTALEAANRLAIEQFRLSETGLMAMLDRYTDMATVVIPLWRQHLFALLHSKARLSRADRDVSDFLLCHEALDDYLSGEAK